MNKNLLLIFSICFAFSLILGGCGEMQEPGISASPAASAEPEPEPPSHEFTPLSIGKQNRLMNTVHCIEEGGKFYCNFFESGSPVFGYYDKQADKYTSLISCASGFMEFIDGSLYCSLSCETEPGLYRFNDTLSETELLYPVKGMGIHDTMQYYDGYFYFKDPDNGNFFSRLSKDGGEPETVLEKEIFYPVIHDGWLLFQDSADGETLHWYSLESGCDWRITDQPSFSPLFDGKYIYYKALSTESEESICRIKADGSEAELLFSGHIESNFTLLDGYIFFVNRDDENRLWRVGTEIGNLSPVNSPPYCQSPMTAGNYLIVEHQVPSLNSFYEYLIISPGSGEIIDIF